MRIALVFVLAALYSQSHALQFIIQSDMDVTYTPTFATGIVSTYPSPSDPGTIYDQTNCSLYTSERGTLSAPGYGGISGNDEHCDAFLSLGVGTSTSSGEAYALGLVTVKNNADYALSTGYSGSLGWSLDLDQNGVGSLDGLWVVSMTVDPYHLDYKTGQQIFDLAQPLVYTLYGGFDFTGVHDFDGSIPFKFSFTTAPGQMSYEYMDAKLQIAHAAMNPAPEPATYVAFGVGVLALLCQRRRQLPRTQMNLLSDRPAALKGTFR